MSDDYTVLPRNFAGTGYDEVSDALARLGRESIRKAIVLTPDGEALLATHGGMPRLYPVNKKVKDVECVDALFPINETDYDNRDFYEDDDDPELKHFRLFSLNGIYSIGRNTLKSMLVTADNGAAMFRMLRAPGDDGAVGPAGYFVETGRTLGEDDKHVAITVSKYALLVVCKALESITFVKQSCSHALAAFRLACLDKGLTTPFTYGKIFGNYTQTGVTKPNGPATQLVGTNGKRFELNLAGSGGFLESFNVEALESIGANGFRYKDAVTGKWAQAAGSFGDAGWFPQMKQFSSPLSGYLTPVGVYVDETMTVELRPEDVGMTESDAIALREGVAPNKKFAPRYFNFMPDAEDLRVGDTPFTLRHDAQFNNGKSAPSAPLELEETQHLYRDPDGVVWLIDIKAGQSSLNEDYRYILVQVNVLRRFDPIFESSLREQESRELASLKIRSEYFPYDDPELRDYYYNEILPSPTNTIVSSLPDGSACAVNVVSTSARGFKRLKRTKFYEPHVTHAVFMVRFHGVGGEDGAGVMATIDRVPVIREWVEIVGDDAMIHTGEPIYLHKEVSEPYMDVVTGPGSYVETTKYDEVVSFARFDFTNGSTMLSGDGGGNPSSLPGGGNGYDLFARERVKVKSLVQLVARADNTFDEIALEYEWGTEFLHGNGAWYATLRPDGYDVPILYGGSGLLVSGGSSRDFRRVTESNVITYEHDHKRYSYEGRNESTTTCSLKYVSKQGVSALAHKRAAWVSGKYEGSSEAINGYIGLPTTYETFWNETISIGAPGSADELSNALALEAIGFKTPITVTLDTNEFYELTVAPTAVTNASLLEYAPVFYYTTEPGGAQHVLRPPKVLWSGYPVSSSANRDCICLDPRHDRVYVAPEPSVAGLFF